MLYANFIRRTDPWREFNRLQRRMNRMYSGGEMNSIRQFPPINVWSNDDEVLVTAELPGFKIEDLHLSIVGNELTMSGKREQPELEENEYFHRHERLHGEFERIVQLPFVVDRKKITARLKDGILSVNLERAEADKPVSIEIKER